MASFTGCVFRRCKRLNRPIPQPLKCLITLKPQQSFGATSNVNCQVDLEVKCSYSYPNAIPSISLMNPKGISHQNVAALQQELNTLAQNLRGEVMILELAQHVQAWLHKHNEMPRYHSFYDEMISNHRKKLEEVERVRIEQQEWVKSEAERKRKAIEEEIMRKQEAFMNESRLWKEGSPSTIMLSNDRKGSISSTETAKAVSPSFGLSGINRRHRNSSRSTSVSSQDLELTLFRDITFSSGGERSVRVGRCLGHSRRGSIVYSGLDMKTGELVILIEWRLNYLKVRPNSIEHDYKKVESSIKQIEQEFNSLLRLRHKNLVHYLGMQHVIEENELVVQILQEFVCGSTLAYHLTDNVPVSCEFLQYYVLGILEGLSYLHNNSIVHRDLRDTSVFLEQGILRIADYSLDRRLSDLWSSVNNAGLEEAFPPSFGRGGKKADIYRLGILCLSLLKGEIVDTMFPEIPKNLPAVIKDFLERCMDRNEQERWSADNLLQHQFLKPSMKEISPLVTNRSAIGAIDKTRPEAPIAVQDGDTEPEVPIVIAQDPNGKSRLHNEFDILKWLGKGGFGDVYKVRNKLDGSIYAIKCIKLKSHNKQLNKKMMREVKLLSRLNHENVVRYFNSWLEQVDVKPGVKSESDESATFKFSQNLQDELSFSNAAPDIVEKIESVDSEWKDSHLSYQSESSSSDDDDDEYSFRNTFLSHMNSSDHIVFHSLNEPSMDKTIAVGTSSVRRSNSNIASIDIEKQSVQYMYIQMELCEKNTLRSAIEENLHLDENRVWRLFREIIEGLAHIHEQGMIHRDLKPGNIFLDKRDHVKIGDFGLATMSNLSRVGVASSVTSGVMSSDNFAHYEVSRSDGFDDGSLTKWVGTEMYISPEIASTRSPPIYTEKVDIYSIGIIFFEMCYHHVATYMEKAKILENLKKPIVKFPVDFDENKNIHQVAIIKWLLDHDPNKRPTSIELLQSNHLPPLQIEEVELKEMLRHTIANPQSKAYKYMISSLFQQDTSIAANVTYDMDIRNKSSFNKNTIVELQSVVETMIRVFQKHGAVQVGTPLIMPKTSLHDNNEFYVKLVDHGGGVITLPYDLRVPFCRFLVKNNISFLKRYFISSVYRERKVFGCHPRELVESAFDIVTPSPGSLIADAEVLNVVWEIVQEFPAIRDCRCFIRINHASLLKGIMQHCGINEEKHQDVFQILNNAEVLGKANVHAELLAMNISELSASTFCRMIEVQGHISKIKSLLKTTVKRKGREASLLKQGINDLETVISNAQAMGLSIAFIVIPHLVYKIEHFSGILFQFVCELKKKKRKVSLEVIAAGGRYDKLISVMRSFVDVSENQEVSQSGVGFSIAVEKLVSAVLDHEDYQPPSTFDVYVCTIGDCPLIKEKSSIVRELWNAGISAHVQYESAQNLEEVRDYCKECHAYAVILKDNEPGSIRVTCWDKDRFLEKKVQASELTEYLLQKGVNRNDSSENSMIISAKMESSRLERSSSESGISSCQFNMTFLTSEKLAPNIKRRYEGQITSHLNQLLQRFSPKLCIEILVVELNSSVLKTMTSHLEIDGDEEKFIGSMNSVIVKHQRHRKYFDKLRDHMCNLLFRKPRPVVILYALTENIYRVFM